jgi:hypothetical protein
LDLQYSVQQANSCGGVFQELIGKWPPRRDDMFARGKSLLPTMRLDPTRFTSDDLVHLALEIFLELDLPALLGVEVERLQRFILAVRSRMFDNPYHNWVHAFDVTQTVYALSLRTGTMSRLSAWEKFALLVGALCHDLEHPGVSSLFLEHAADLAPYFKGPVLEKHHALRAFEVMVDREIGILDGLNTVEYYEFRGNVSKAILATEIARHKDYISRMDEHLAGHQNTAPQDASKVEASHIDKQFEMEIMIKAADISNVLKPFSVAKRWAIRVTDEFFLQGDEEAARGLPKTPACDRETQSRVALQVGFIDFVCSPFYDRLAQIYPDIRDSVEQMQENRNMWAAYTDESLEAERSLCSSASGSLSIGVLTRALSL